MSSLQDLNECCFFNSIAIQAKIPSGIIDNPTLSYLEYFVPKALCLETIGRISTDIGYLTASMKLCAE